jgi:hypothetical protein
MLRDFGFLSFHDGIESDGIERSIIGRPFGRLANTKSIATFVTSSLVYKQKTHNATKDQILKYIIVWKIRKMLI